MEVSSFQSYLIIFCRINNNFYFCIQTISKNRSEELNLVKFEQKGLDSLTQAQNYMNLGLFRLKKDYILKLLKLLKAIENYENEPMKQSNNK